MFVIYVEQNKRDSILQQHITSGKIMSIVVFWIMTPCSLLGGHQRFGETCIRLHVQDTWQPLAKQHGVMAQKTSIHIFIAVKTKS